MRQIILLVPLFIIARISVIILCMHGLSFSSTLLALNFTTLHSIGKSEIAPLIKGELFEKRF